jgi:hypothetical protein
VAFTSFASNLVPNDTNGEYDVFVHDYLGSIEPVPDIKANSSDGPIIVSPTEPVSITVGLNPGNQTGQRADWWIGAFTPFGNYWLNPSLQWVPSSSPISVGQYPLFNLLETKLLDTPLPVGIYTFFFVLDPPDGKFGVTLYDLVNVISQAGVAPMDTLPDFKALFQEKIEELMRESQESREP